VVVVLVGGGFFCLPGQGVVVVALVRLLPSVVVNDWEFHVHSTSFSSTKKIK
jgi:hypothetical protein